VAREPAHVPGLGTFEVRHHPSSRVRTESGEQRFVPPRPSKWMRGWRRSWSVFASRSLAAGPPG
jgi:hypothetical protein